MQNEAETRLLGYDTSDPEQFDSLVHHLKDELLSGKTAKEVLDLPESELESIYSVAYQKYQLGEYQKAADLFQYLLLLDSESYRVILGVAASLHKLKQYEPAANHYLLASFHEPSNPIPYFHGAECFLQLGKREMALNGVTLAAELAEGNADYEELKERALLIRAKLEEESEIT